MAKTEIPRSVGLAYKCSRMTAGHVTLDPSSPAPPLGQPLHRLHIESLAVTTTWVLGSPKLFPEKPFVPNPHPVEISEPTAKSQARAAL